MLWSSALTTYCPGERSRFLAYFNGVGFTPAKVVSLPTTMEEVWTAIRAAEEATILRVHHPEELLAIAETYGRDRGAIPTPYPGGVVPPAPSTVVRRRSGGSRSRRPVTASSSAAGLTALDNDARDAYVGSLRRQYNAAVADVVALQRRLTDLRRHEEETTGMAFGDYRALGEPSTVPGVVDELALARVVGVYRGDVGEAAARTAVAAAAEADDEDEDDDDDDDDDSVEV